MTAAILVIGDEILSGRTQDTNIGAIARFLGTLGIDLDEARVVADREEAIVAAVNALRARHTYVFTTGGIGPTHDDITADAIARAFGVGIGPDAEAMALLKTRYGAEFNERRQRMARIPEGASLIQNPVSGAPGFQIGNVFVMAGVPKIMQAMLEDVAPRLTRGAPVVSESLTLFVSEGRIAEALAEVQGRHPRVAIGSYPFFPDDAAGRPAGTTLVVRGRDGAAVGAAVSALGALAQALGLEVGAPPATR